MSGPSLNRKLVGLGLVAVVALAAVTVEALKWETKTCLSMDGKCKVMSSGCLKFPDREDPLILKTINSTLYTSHDHPRVFLSLHHDNALIDFYLDEILIDGKKMLQCTKMKLFIKKGLGFVEACTKMGGDIMWLMQDTMKLDKFVRKGDKLVIDCPKMMGKVDVVDSIVFDHLDIEIDTKRF